MTKHEPYFGDLSAFVYAPEPEKVVWRPDWTIHALIEAFVRESVLTTMTACPSPGVPSVQEADLILRIYASTYASCITYRWDDPELDVQRANMEQSCRRILWEVAKKALHALASGERLDEEPRPYGRSAFEEGWAAEAARFAQAVVKKGVSSLAERDGLTIREAAGTELKVIERDLDIWFTDTHQGGLHMAKDIISTDIRGDHYQGILHVGQRVFCELGRSGTIVAINDEPNGEKTFDIAFDPYPSTGIPETFICSHQWRLSLLDGVAGDEVSVGGEGGNDR